MRNTKLFTAVFVLSSLTLSASGGGHDAHHFDIVKFMGAVVNSVLLFGGLIYLLKKPISDLLGKVGQDIKTDIKEREAKLEKSEKQVEELKARLEEIEKEVDSVKEEARLDGEKERARIEENARAEAEKILRLAEEEIQSRVDLSVNRLKEKIADMTIEHFRKSIGDNLNDDLHRKIVEKNITMSGEIIER